MKWNEKLHIFIFFSERPKRIGDETDVVGGLFGAFPAPAIVSLSLTSAFAPYSSSFLPAGFISIH